MSAASPAGSASRAECWFLLIVVAAVLGWSAYQPSDRLTWWLEVLPAVIAAPLLIWTRRRFPLTRVLYYLIALHAVILIVGGHYTYAHVPLGFWMQDWFGFDRNHYDRIGHIAQGFVPAILAREILLRTSPLKPGAWLFYIVVSICLAFSAFYEFIEWWAALVTGDAATEFLGTQGDVWDTQWDMFLCMVGAITALVTLSWLHNRQLKLLFSR